MLWWLLKQLRSDDRDIFLRAAEKAARAREVRAIDPLLEALQHRNPWFREAAARALAAIGDPRVIPPLRTLLDDSDSLVREAVKMALAHLEGAPLPLPEASTATAEEAPFVFEDDTTFEEHAPDVPAAPRDFAPTEQESSPPRAQADRPTNEPLPLPAAEPDPPPTADSTAEPAEPGADAVPAGQSQPAPTQPPSPPSPTPPAVEAAPPPPKKRLESLQEALLAVQGAGTPTPISARKPDTAEDLLRAVTSTTLLSGATAAKAARSKATTPPPAFSALDRIVQRQLAAPSQSPRERRADDSDEAGSALTVVAGLLADSDRTVRRTAVKTLADMSSPQAVPVLVGVVADPDAGVAAAAADALIGYGQTAVEALLPLLDRPDEQARAAAIAIINRIDPDWREPTRDTGGPTPPEEGAALPASVEPEPAADEPASEGQVVETDSPAADASVPAAPATAGDGPQPEASPVEAPPSDASLPATGLETPLDPTSAEPLAAPPQEPVTDAPPAAASPEEQGTPVAADLAPAVSPPGELILALVSDDDVLRTAAETVIERLYPGWRQALIDPAIVDALASALNRPNGSVTDAARRCLSSLTDPAASDALMRAEGDR
jgi:HEAT repeat protein